jgi:DNA-binding SARP family transcriptional activator
MAEATTSADTVRIELLGAPRLLLDGCGGHALERKDAALLAMLALDGKGPRTRIAALLWPDADAEQARNNLRQRLFRLRRLAGRDLVRAGETLALAVGVEHDLVEVAEPEAAAARSELLGTLEYADCSELEDWVASARARWRQRHRAVLEKHIDRLERDGRIAAALLCAERLVADDPVAEDATQRLMRLHTARGDRAAALAAYQKLQEALARELAAQPAESTRALAARIAGGAAAGSDAQRVHAPIILRPPRLIGRDLEWRKLEQAWSAGRCALALGEPGIGKSRLLADFVAARDAAVMSSARRGDATIPYALLARIVRNLIARYDAPAAPWVRAELARLAPEIGVAAGGALDAVRLVHALVQLVDHARTGGLAGLVLDDLHHADDASLEGLVALLGHETTRGLRLLAAARAGEEPRVLREWRLAGAAVEIRLGALGRDGVAALLASLALPDFDTVPWVEPLFRHTGGNPLFVLETLRAVLAGATPRDASLPAPAHVGELITLRLAQLASDALELAQIAALAGQDFSAELAAAVLRKHVLDIADAWRELEAAQVLREGAFAHDLILEAALRAVPGDAAPGLHRSIGTYLEAQRAPAARVAEHWYHAGEWGKAARQFDAAARAQFDASRYLEAGELFRRAAACFESAGHQPERHAALQELAGCQVKAFDLLGAREVAQQLQQIAANDEQRGWALDRLADVLNMSREDDRAAQTAASDMQQLGHATGKPWMIFNATRKLAVALAQQGRYEQALALFETQQDWVQANLHEWNVQVWFCDHGFVLDLGDRRGKAVAEYLRAEMLARQHENWAVAYAALRNLAFTHAWAGRLDTAVRTSDQAAGFSGRLGEALVERNPRDAARRGALLRDAGRLSESLALLRGAHATLARGGSPYWLAYCEDQLALLYAVLGQPARARDLLARNLGTLPPEAILSRRLVRARVARAEGHEPMRWSDAEVASAGDPACPARWRLLALLEQARNLDTVPALGICNEVAAQAGARELGGVELDALALAAGRSTAADMMEVAAGHAQRAHALAETIWPTGISLPELCLSIHGGLAAAGNSTAATQAADRAVRWIEEQALPNVPVDFRDSFLSRNPANRAVLTRVGRSPRR